MIEWFVDVLREYPPVALFLTIGLGFLIGRIHFGSFQLGSVTSVLLVGILVGQLNIAVSGPIKNFFFMLFLFSIGYSVGPDFFKSLRGYGAKQALFAVLMSMTCCGVTLLISYIFNYSKGETVGLFSGSQTCSALLGVGAEAIQKLGLPADELKQQLDMTVVCYAVTYIFGTLGTVIIIGNLGPKLLGGTEKVKKLTAEYEEKLDKGNDPADPALISAHSGVDYRVYRLENSFFDVPRTVSETEKMLHHLKLDVYIDRKKQDGTVSIVRHYDVLNHGNEIVICGRAEFIVSVEPHLGPELNDRSLLDYPVARLDVIVSKKEFTGVSITQLRRRPYMHGVVIRRASRHGEPIEIELDTKFEKGDRLSLIGQEVKVLSATRHIGHVDRPSYISDLMFVGLAIFVGGLFGAISFWVDSIPVSFGTTGGSLIAGIVFGWLRTRRPSIGHIPKGALWVMNNLGLNVFIAVVGITAAPMFVSGLKTVGPLLFVAGAVGTMIPVFFGLWLGHKVFKFTPAITLGCCAGTRTCTAALGAAQDALGSSIPAIGYTVTYAVSNILLVIWGIVAVMLS